MEPRNLRRPEPLLFEVSRPGRRGFDLPDLHAALKAAAAGPMKGVLGYSEEPLVSMDLKGDEHSSIVDGPLTNVQGGNMVKIVTWYDNEWGFSNRMLDTMLAMMQAA